MKPIVYTVLNYVIKLTVCYYVIMLRALFLNNCSSLCIKLELKSLFINLIAKTFLAVSIKYSDKKMMKTGA